MVAAVDERRARVEPLERKDGERNLDRPAASVHKVAVEEHRVALRRVAREREEVDEIKELGVQK